MNTSARFVDASYVAERLSSQSGIAVDYEVGDVFAAEQAAQANVCRMPEGDLMSDHPLAEALVRRVARNVAMRNAPLGVVMDEAGGLRIGSTDPEIRRLEGPYRKLPIG